MDLDLVIRNGTVVSASDILQDCDIGIKDGTIVVVGKNLPASQGAEEVDAEGAFVTPGGVDSHCHLSQFYDPGPGQEQKTQVTDGNIPPEYNFAGDDYESGSRSAIAGGTTTIMSFAVQYRDDESLKPVIQEYHKLAKGKAYCDYSFHVIVTNPTPTVLKEDLPQLITHHGLSSIKIFMTYESAKLSDYQILGVLNAARSIGITTMVHAENADVVEYLTDQLEANDMVQPHYHGTSRPPLVEAEATNRVVALAELMSAPVLLVHVSSALATKVIRKAQTRGLAVHGETCPHYLFLLAERMNQTGFEGAKFVCSPPLRETSSDLDAIWQGVQNGTFTTISSDHAPTKYDHPNGKMKGLCDHGPDGKFKYIPNGLPGLETRLPLLFTGGVLSGRISPQKFVELTSSNPAKVYGLTRKGAIAPGMDADITIWYPQDQFEPFRLSNDMLHHAIDYTPYEGFEFRNWPRYTFLRGQLMFAEGKLVGPRGTGAFVRRATSALAACKPVTPTHGGISARIPDSRRLDMKSR